MTDDTDRPGPRLAGRSDLETVTRIIALAFAEDPVWGPAFDGKLQDQLDIWRAYLQDVMRLPGTWLSAGGEATSVWIPPGEAELTDGGAEAFERAYHERLGRDAERVDALFERFEAAHPRREPHHYLSLLGTHPDHRGAGHGMRLLADNLALIDGQGLAAYLESTNPANDARYGRVGFEPVGSFEGFVPGSTITTMWRPARR